MKRFALLTSLVALAMGTASMLRAGRHNQFPSANENVAQMTDGAFRDGLYLGRLAAERGAEPHVAIGRWVTPEDRLSFTSGYQRGYGHILASHAASTTHERGAE